MKFSPYAVFVCALLELFEYTMLSGSSDPAHVWPLSTDFFGYDAVTDEPSATLHDCSFGAARSPGGRPSFVLDRSSHVDVNIKDSFSGDFSLLLYLFVDKSTNTGPLYEYVDQWNNVIFKVILVDRFLLLFVYDGLGSLISSIASTFPVVQGWNHITVGRKKSEGKAYIYLEDTDKIVVDIDFSGDIPLPGTLRLGQSPSITTNLVGRIFCLQLFSVELCRDNIDNYMVQPLCEVSPLLLYPDKESTCIRHPKEANRAYFNLIASNMGPGNSTRSPAFGIFPVTYRTECGSICLSKPACWSFAISGQRGRPMVCALYNITYDIGQLESVAGLKYFKARYKEYV